MALALKKEMLAEEMRLLYVAMTRAKEKLILTHSLPYGPTDLKNLAESLACPADPRVLAGCSTVGQWVLLTAMARPEGAVLRKVIQREDLPLPQNAWGPAWKIFYHHGAVSQEAARQPAPSEQGTGEAVPRAELLRQLLWHYPYAAATATPAKVTATQVAAQAPEEPGVFLLRDPSAGPGPFQRPRFAQDTLGLTPAQLSQARQSIERVMLEFTLAYMETAICMDTAGIRESQVRELFAPIRTEGCPEDFRRAWQHDLPFFLKGRFTGPELTLSTVCKKYGANEQELFLKVRRKMKEWDIQPPTPQTQDAFRRDMREIRENMLGGR